MPGPLLLLIPVIAKAAVAAKTAAVAAKGGVIIAKAAGGKAVLTKGIVGAAHAYGWGAVISTGAVVTLTVGAAATLFEKGSVLRAALDEGDIAASMRAASALAGELAGHGGLDGAANLLHDFLRHGGQNVEIVSRTSSMLDELLKQLRARLG